MAKNFNKSFLSFFNEAKQEHIENLYSTDFLLDPPFEEIFKGRKRFLIKAINNNFLESCAILNIRAEKFDFQKRTYNGQNINTFLKLLKQGLSENNLTNETLMGFFAANIILQIWSGS